MAPPESEEELLGRAVALAGRDLGTVAKRFGWVVPEDLRRDKGWVGQLLEQALGATAGSDATPDFPDLGVELKTLPVDRSGRPRESTWVCTAPMDALEIPPSWQRSHVRAKLIRVLWIPVLADAAVPLARRTVASPLLWSPSPEQERDLRADWEELTDLLRVGRIGEIDARRGRWLQLRPKAAHSREAQWVLAEDGEWVVANPRGFYLRARFTAGILRRHFALPG